MVHLDSALDVDGRPPAAVFDFMVDFRNENDWDDFNRNVHKVSDGPLGAGTKFRADNVKLGAVDVEVVAYERPVEFAYRIESKMGTMVFRARFAAAGEGTRVTMSNDLAPKGFYRLLSPLIGSMMRKQQPSHQQKLRRYMETHALVARSD